MKKAIISILILTILGFVLLVSCGRDTQPAETIQQTTAAEETTEEETAEKTVYLPSISDVVSCGSYLHREQIDNYLMYSNRGKDAIKITLEEYDYENDVSVEDVVQKVIGTESKEEAKEWMDRNRMEDAGEKKRYGNDSIVIVEEDGTIATIQLLDDEYSDSFKEFSERISFD